MRTGRASGVGERAQGGCSVHVTARDRHGFWRALESCPIRRGQESPSTWARVLVRFLVTLRRVAPGARAPPTAAFGSSAARVPSRPGGSGARRRDQGAHRTPCGGVPRRTPPTRLRVFHASTMRSSGDALGGSFQVETRLRPLSRRRRRTSTSGSRWGSARPGAGSRTRAAAGLMARMRAPAAAGHAAQPTCPMLYRSALDPQV
jgi:hypothetical protein